METLDDYFYINPAKKHGDLSPLIENLRSPNPALSPQLLNFIADLLERKVRLPNRRPRKEVTLDRNIEIAWFVVSAERAGRLTKQAVDAAKEKFGVSERTVFYAVGPWRRREDDLRAVQESLY